jgi:hypothetical protein
VKSCQYQIIRYWGVPDGTGFFAANLSLIWVFRSESDSELGDDGEDKEEDFLADFSLLFGLDFGFVGFADSWELELEVDSLESLESEDAFIMRKKRGHQRNGHLRTVRIRA